ncbi:Por secretion system C-terminal sorting domain-containing protein [Chitinophaga jiangningensis]|uniref:Por secretion system C-terminal sorting domain-containing protein n=1 Tax=Chitinophaga jiangningensis TaxID=1419482 RepID=A0A1M6VYK7_9BACT|nr:MULTISPECIES: T9SS type A sorting domain-containing protein [Chitinophaga]MBV7533413.1 T9SS type A sorting domain-containing protein [Chitinophaga sp. sic0106]SHK86523.1 Por secretion system C-terminal sorting domain-containing protein [Chitinophaga jiangningensis]
MLKSSTLILSLVFCLFSLVSSAQTDKSQPATDGGSKIVRLYPNPATSAINFEIQQLHNNERLYDLIVYNFLGKKIDQLKSIGQRTTVNLDNYYSGLYIYQLRDRRGNLVESGKFNVVK